MSSVFMQTLLYLTVTALIDRPLTTAAPVDDGRELSVPLSPFGSLKLGQDESGNVQVGVGRGLELFGFGASDEQTFTAGKDGFSLGSNSGIKLANNTLGSERKVGFQLPATTAATEAAEAATEPAETEATTAEPSTAEATTETSNKAADDLANVFNILGGIFGGN